MNDSDVYVTCRKPPV